MEGEGKRHGCEEERVDPGRHHQQGLVLRERVDGVGHLDGDQDGEGHAHRLRGLEDLAGDSLELVGLAHAGQPVGELRRRKKLA